MDPEQARELLQRERLRIEAALAGLSTLASDEPAGELQESDQDGGLYEAELDEGRADDLREDLAALERAEARLAAGTYGLSIESGEPIPDDRLAAVPTAERTTAEQARFDRGTG